MTVEELIEKLQNVVDKSKDVYLDDGLSVNVIGIEAVVDDDETYIILLSPTDVSQDELSIYQKLL